jgi:hypothetical protein
MKERVNEILASITGTPHVRVEKAISDSRIIRDALSRALIADSRPDIAGQVFSVFVDVRNQRVTTRWTPLDANTDAEAVERFQGFIPIGYIVTVDTTRDGDEEITAFVTRKPTYKPAEDTLADAQLRIGAMVRDELESVYRVVEATL